MNFFQVEGEAAVIVFIMGIVLFIAVLPVEYYSGKREGKGPMGEGMAGAFLGTALQFVAVMLIAISA